MKTRYRLLTGLLALLAVPLIAFSADRKEASTDVSKSKPAATAVQQPVVAPQESPKSTQAISGTVNPTAGEQIKWQVVSSGGNRGTSTNFVLSATVGQTAVGSAASPNFRVNQGFWQSFVTSCCTGTTGNVNMTGIVDLGDLSALVSYLTGGGYILPCQPEANVNATGIVDLSDLSALVSYLTGGGYVLPNCP